MRRASSPFTSAVSFGPGPLSRAIRALVGLNVAVFLLDWVLRGSNVLNLAWTFGLNPASVVRELHVWQLGTYMFLHGGLFHILFNMLGLWMFGTELERIWGTRYFLKFYFTTGIGAAVLTVLVSLLPGSLPAILWNSYVVGASGAIYGLLLAYAMYFPERPIIIFIFPVPAKYAVMIIGAIALLSGDGMGVANTTHLGGLLIGYAMLKGGRIDPLAEAKYWYLRWKMNRVRKKFGVYEGGRTNDWNRRVH
jgi:membrane associated rhomboid family serine protease